MKSWNLSTKYFAATSGTAEDKLKPQELAIIGFDDFSHLKKNIKLFERVFSETKRVVLSSTTDCFSSKEFQTLLSKFPVYALSVRINLPAKTSMEYTGIADTTLYRNDTTDLFRKITKLFPDINVVPEIILKGDFASLQATLLHFAKLPILWITLRPLTAPKEAITEKLRSCFEFLQMVNMPEKEIYFSFDQPYQSDWQMQSHCIFSGLREVHIDLTNRCTHSCNFCGLYSNMAIDHLRIVHQGEIPLQIREFMGKEMPKETALAILQSLPETVDKIQFGGVGDPMMHPNFFEIVAMARNRNIQVEVLSNMSYLDDEKIKRLHELGGPYDFDLHFIVNLSGSNSDVYVKTRPRQNAAVFEKVVNSLDTLSSLREENDGSGVNFTLMCVTHIDNFHDAENYVKLGEKLRANRVWLKPMEVHGPTHVKLLIKESDLDRYKKEIKNAIIYADENNVHLHDREDVEKLLGNYK